MRLYQHPPEPTSDECSAERRFVWEDQPAIAVWYPQIGGYVGKAVVVINDPTQQANSCFDVYLWHDGEFPFTGGTPKELHHCMAEQFVRFGDTVQAYQTELLK